VVRRADVTRLREARPWCNTASVLLSRFHFKGKDVRDCDVVLKGKAKEFLVDNNLSAQSSDAEGAVLSPLAQEVAS
jgi:hypothetical protein